MEDPRGEVTRLLRQEGAAGDELLELVYRELHSLARGRMSRERSNHTLQPTALVHEAYLKLVGEEQLGWHGRRQFYGAAGEAMRRILIDHARKQKSLKRGGAHEQVTLGTPESPLVLDSDQTLALDEALTKLTAEDPRAAEVARLRFYSGLSVEETAATLEVSERTVHREWTYARARLFDMLGD